MKANVSLLLLITAMASSISFACGLDWSIPSSHFDGVDDQGYVEYWEKVDDIDFGDGLKFPIMIGFCSQNENGTPSRYLGAGWILPLLESNMVQTTENSFLMMEPDGWSNLFLRKDNTTLYGSANWMATINGDIITAWAECGWTLNFYKGRLTSITTPQNRKLDFVRTGGMVTAIQENGTTKLSVEQDDAGKVIAILYGNHRLVIT